MIMKLIKEITIKLQNIITNEKPSKIINTISKYNKKEIEQLEYQFSKNQ